jgi:fructokinase
VISVLGEALVDIIVDPRGEVASVVGGAPLNTARTIARLGIPATFLGGVSTDAFGERIMRLLEADGVTLGLGSQVPEPTTLAIAQIDAHGAATYRFMMEGTSAAAVTPEMAVSHVDASVRALHVGTLGLVLQPLADASVALVNSALGDQLVMVDPNCRPSVMTGSAVFAEALASVLPRADVVKVSGDDLAFLYPTVERAQAAADLARSSGSVVLFTDGAEAVRILAAGTEVVVDVPRVPVVDTVGAGDSFSGGFLAWWMHHGKGREDLADVDSVVAAARFGVAVASITCQRAGAEPPHIADVPGGWS